MESIYELSICTLIYAATLCLYTQIYDGEFSILIFSQAAASSLCGFLHIYWLFMDTVSSYEMQDPISYCTKKSALEFQVISLTS